MYTEKASSFQGPKSLVLSIALKANCIHIEGTQAFLMTIKDLTAGFSESYVVYLCSLNL